MTRSRLVFACIIAAVAALPSLGCGGSSAAHPAPSSESVAKAVTRVTAGKLERKTLQRWTLQPATIRAFEEAPLYPKIAGYAQEVLVDIGDRVEKDQLLVRFSVPELHDEVVQKESLVAQAEAEIEQADAAIAASQATLATAKAGIREAEAAVVRTTAEHNSRQSEHGRIVQLASNGSVTAKLADEALNQLRAAQAAGQEAAAGVESAQAALAESEAGVTTAQAGRRAAEARLRVAQADLARAKTMLAYTEIRAPFTGVITRREVDTGHYVQPTQTGRPLLVITRCDSVRVFTDVPELEAAMVDPGDPATLRVQALPGRQFEGTITRTSWSLDAANRSLQAEIDLPNPEGLLRPGMYATARILLDERAEVLTLPEAALVRDADQTVSCYCVRGGKAVRTPVTLGLANNDEFEVVSGLQGDEIVVLAHAESLEDGQPVAVLPPEAK